MSGLLLKTPMGVWALHDIAQLASEFDVVSRKSPSRANSKDRQNLEQAPI
jgi:hypothetical protein